MINIDEIVKENYTKGADAAERHVAKTAPVQARVVAYAVGVIKTQARVVKALGTVISQ